MKKTLLYIGILAVLGFGVWYFLFHEGGNVFGTREAGFTVRDTGAVGKIFLADNNGHAVTLERKADGQWYANGYKAIGAQVTQILKTLNQQVPLHPVPEASHNLVVKMLAGQAIKVEVYDRQGKPMRIFYVGNEVQNFQGTYMLMDGASRPFVVGIPGYDGYLTPRYNADLVTWRDRTVFNIPAEEIAQASVQYVRQPLNSFAVLQQKEKVTVNVHPELMAGKSLNERRAKIFLGFFKDIYAEGVVNGLPGLDSIIREMPKVGTIEVTGAHNYRQHADIYFFPLNKRSKNLDAPGEDLSSNYDADRFYAVINNNKDTVVVQQQRLNKIFRPGYEFYQVDQEKPVQDISMPAAPQVPFD